MNACLCFYARSALTAIEFVIVAGGIQKPLELSMYVCVLLSKSVNVTGERSMFLKNRTQKSSLKKN